MAGYQGDAEHKGVRLGGGQTQQKPPEGDGGHKEYHEQQVQGQEPHGGEQVAFVGIFHHGHVEFPGQKRDGPHGNQRLRQESKITVLRAGIKEGQVAELGGLADAGENFAKAAVKAEGHQKTDGEEGGELDQGLESHGRHHAFVAFRRVEMPGPEHDAERRHDQGHKQAGVQVNRVAERGGAMAGQDIVGHRDRLELQAVIRDQRQQDPQGRQGAHQSALAVPQGEKVGQGGEVVLLADPQQSAQEEPPEKGAQGGAEIDRQEADPLGGGPAHPAEKSQSGDVNRQGQGIDHRIGNDASAPGPPPVAVIGNGEQDEEITDGRGGYGKLAEHGVIARQSGLPLGSQPLSEAKQADNAQYPDKKQIEDGQGDGVHRGLNIEDVHEGIAEQEKKDDPCENQQFFSP